MFHNTAAETVTQRHSVESPADLIPVSHLELDLPRPPEGWSNFFGVRGIAIRPDHIGRDAISSHDASRLIGEQREAEIRRQKLAKVAEQEAVEADEKYRAQIWKGLPADQLPVGVAAAAAMLQADYEARPRRRSMLQEALSGETLTYHSLPRGDE